MISEKRIEKIAGSMSAGAGMSHEAFRAVVYRLIRKISVRYGGSSRGSVAEGTLSDGTTWSVTIVRQNASNGEVAGGLQITVSRPGQSSKTNTYWNDWDNAFEKEGIPVVSRGMVVSSVERTADFGDVSVFFNISDFLETVDGSSFVPNQIRFFESLVGGTTKYDDIVRKQIDFYDHALIRYGLKKKGRVL